MKKYLSTVESCRLRYNKVSPTSEKYVLDLSNKVGDPYFKDIVKNQPKNYETPIIGFAEKVYLVARGIQSKVNADRRKAELSIKRSRAHPELRKSSKSGKYITGVFLKPKDPSIGYGDIPCTNDLLIFLFAEDWSYFDVILLPDKLDNLDFWLKQYSSNGQHDYRAVA